jgi:hypothetical protein
MIFLTIVGYGLLFLAPFAIAVWALVFWFDVSHGEWWGLTAALFTCLIIAAAALQVASWLGLVSWS